MRLNSVTKTSCRMAELDFPNALILTDLSVMTTMAEACDKSTDFGTLNTTVVAFPVVTVMCNFFPASTALCKVRAALPLDRVGKTGVPPDNPIDNVGGRGFEELVESIIERLSGDGDDELKSTKAMIARRANATTHVGIQNFNDLGIAMTLSYH